MALLKSIKTEYGVEATYWKIVQMNIDCLNKQVHVELGGWLNQEMRDNGKEPLMTFGFDYSGDTFPFTGEEPQNEREIVYGKIKTEKIKTINHLTHEVEKTDGKFVGSTDC